MKISNKKGFTLIELLVVISIIAMLSSIVLASVTTARTKAQYAAAASDFHQLEIALQLYRLSVGSYPFLECVPNMGTNCTLNLFSSHILDVLIPNYIAALPTPPPGSGWEYGIASIHNATNCWGGACNFYISGPGQVTCAGVTPQDHIFFIYRHGATNPDPNTSMIGFGSLTGITIPGSLNAVAGGIYCLAR